MSYLYQQMPHAPPGALGSQDARGGGSRRLPLQLLQRANGRVLTSPPAATLLLRPLRRFPHSVGTGDSVTVRSHTDGRGGEGTDDGTPFSCRLESPLLCRVVRRRAVLHRPTRSTPSTFPLARSVPRVLVTHAPTRRSPGISRLRRRSLEPRRWLLHPRTGAPESWFDAGAPRMSLGATSDRRWIDRPAGRLAGSAPVWLAGWACTRYRRDTSARMQRKYIDISVTSLPTPPPSLSPFPHPLSRPTSRFRVIA